MNSGLPVKDSGVGGTSLVVPIAREAVGGVLGRYERSDRLEFGCSCTYCNGSIDVLFDAKIVIKLTMCSLFGSVDRALFKVKGEVLAVRRRP